MKTLVVAVVLLLWSGGAGVGASEPTNTAGPIDCSLGICTQRLVKEKVPVGTTTFHWTTLTQLFNAADAGENVASYSQSYKQGLGTTWAIVGETRCVNVRGGCHGAEIDLVVDGPLARGEPEFGGQWDWRLGQSIVIWKMPGSRGRPEANYGLIVAPQWDQRENIRVDVGVGVTLRCNIACLQIRSGERIALDDEGRITLRYNPATHAVELANGTRVVWTVPTE